MYSKEGAAFRRNVVSGLGRPPSGGGKWLGKTMVKKGGGFLASLLAALATGGNPAATLGAKSLVEGALDKKLVGDQPRGPLANVIDLMSMTDNYRKLNSSATSWAKKYQASSDYISPKSWVGVGGK